MLLPPCGAHLTGSGAIVRRAPCVIGGGHGGVEPVSAHGSPDSAALAWRLIWGGAAIARRREQENVQGGRWGRASHRARPSRKFHRRGACCRPRSAEVGPGATLMLPSPPTKAVDDIGPTTPDERGRGPTGGGGAASGKTRRAVSGHRLNLPHALRSRASTSARSRASSESVRRTFSRAPARPADDGCRLPHPSADHPRNGAVLTVVSLRERGWRSGARWWRRHRCCCIRRTRHSGMRTARASALARRARAHLDQATLRRWP